MYPCVLLAWFHLLPHLSLKAKLGGRSMQPGLRIMMSECPYEWVLASATRSMCQYTEAAACRMVARLHVCGAVLQPVVLLQQCTGLAGAAVCRRIHTEAMMRAITTSCSYRGYGRPCSF